MKEEEKKKKKWRIGEILLGVGATAAVVGCAILGRKNAKLKGKCKEQERTITELLTAVQKSCFYHGKDLAELRK